MTDRGGTPEKSQESQDGRLFSLEPLDLTEAGKRKQTNESMWTESTPLDWLFSEE